MFATVYHLCITDVMSESVFLPFSTLLEGFVLFCVTVNMSSPVDRSVHIMRPDKYFEERSASPLVEDSLYSTKTILCLFCFLVCVCLVGIYFKSVLDE